MNFSEFGNVLGPSDVGGSRSAQTPGARKYDDLAGATLLRRTGRAGAMSARLRGDQAATPLASRRRPETDDRVTRQLREFYQTMLREPVPERFVALVEALDSRDR